MDVCNDFVISLFNLVYFIGSLSLLSFFNYFYLVIIYVSLIFPILLLLCVFPIVVNLLYEFDFFNWLLLFFNYKLFDDVVLIKLFLLLLLLLEFILLIIFPVFIPYTKFLYYYTLNFLLSSIDVLIYLLHIIYYYFFLNCFTTSCVSIPYILILLFGLNINILHNKSIY